MSQTSVFSKMTGTKAIVRFVKEIERHPCLYDQKSLDYSNRELKRRTWIEIAKKANSTVRDCKEKWIKIRIAYIRTLRPSYNRSRTVRTPYYLANYLKFVTPIKQNLNGSQPYPSENNHPLAETNETMTINELDKPSINLNDSQGGNPQHQVYMHEDINGFDDDDYEVIQNNNGTVIDTKEAVLNEMNTMQVKEAVHRNYHENGRTAKKIPCCRNIECNPRKMFLLSLLPEIEHLNETQMRSFRRQMIRLIDNALGES